MDKVIDNVLTPIDDSKIKYYLPDARIYKYNELNQYNNIEDLLPYDKSYFILLVESDYNYGHWVSVSRINNTIQYHDPYGLYPSSPLGWNTKEKNETLGQQHKYLNDLFDKTPLKVVYNCYDFQNNNKDIATCGRHIVLYLLLLKEKSLSLEEYVKLIKKQKINPDLLISSIIL
jgi:hypothetical protein